MFGIFLLRQSVDRTHLKFTRLVQVFPAPGVLCLPANNQVLTSPLSFPVPLNGKQNLGKPLINLAFETIWHAVTHAHHISTRTKTK